MNAEEVRSRAAAGEDSRTELKHADPGALPDADDIAKALVAFANSGGGDVFFGIDDDGSITGIGGRADSDKLQLQISQIAANSITPPLQLLPILAIAVDGKLVIVARVPEFLPERPFRGKSKYFIRDGNQSREARPDELKRLLTSAPIHYLDEQPLDRAARSDLDDDAIAEFLGAAYPSARSEQTERYLIAMQAVVASGTPTVTGIVLFCKDPARFLPGAYVSAVRFPGTQATGQFLDRAEIHGTVFTQIEDAVGFLTRHVAMPSRIEGLERVQGGIPVEVWREAVTNASSHRDHASPNQIRIFVFDDRVEIANPGELLNKLTVESIRLAGTKQPRNPHIASAVARRALRDNLGIGVPEIFRLLDQHGLPEPQIDVAGGEFRLTIFTRA